MVHFTLQNAQLHFTMRGIESFNKKLNQRTEVRPQSKQQRKD